MSVAPPGNDLVPPAAAASGREARSGVSAPGGFHRTDRFRRWAAVGASFLLGQSSIQAVGLVTGILLLRWLSVEAYAQYSFAFSIQSILGSLVDLGVSGSIVALIGDRGGDPRVVGRYLGSAQRLRTRLLLWVIPAAALLLPYVTARHGWPVATQCLLFLAVAGSLVFQGWIAFYSIPLLIARRLGAYYAPQLLVAVGRLLLYYAMYSASVLSSWAAVAVHTVMTAVNGWLFRRHTGPEIQRSSVWDADTEREIRRYVAPLAPGLIFVAFQAQISVILISLFGETRGIAEIAALGRISQLFLVLTAFNGVVVSPYIAAVRRELLARRYFQILGASIAVSGALCALALLFPAPLLWLLGSEYQNLRVEIGWAIVIAAVNYVGGVMWTMHSARRWIYWWGSFAFIGVVAVTQILGAFLFDLGRTLDVIYLSALTSAALFCLMVVGGVYGFRHGPRGEGASASASATAD